MAALSPEGPASSPPVTDLRWMRSSRIHVSQHDGSWASPLRKTSSTVVSEMKEVISKKENVFGHYHKGVGTKGGKIDKIIGGAIGTGLILSVMDSFIHLAGEFEMGDIIIIVGFSRGSYAARILAALLEVIGLPKISKLSGARKNKLFQKIHRGLVSGDLWKRDRLNSIRDGFKFHDKVSIEALCLFDTVTAVGLPKSGLGRHLSPFLRMFPIFRKNYAHLEDIIRKAPSNVRLFFQALSVHESRATYAEQVACQASGNADQIFRQQWFFGNHGNMAQDNGRSCMVDAPLAWMVGLFHLHVPYLRLDEDFLHRRFPTYPASMTIANSVVGQRPMESSSSTSIDKNNTNNSQPQHTDPPLTPLPPWIYDPISRASSFKNLCHGSHLRTPGRYGPSTMETVHPTVRLRGFGRTRTDVCMIPGYVPVQRDDGAWEWKLDNKEKTKTFFWPMGEKKLAPLLTIPEGKVSPLEAALLGWA